MRINRSSQRGIHRAGGFTLVELLVVIGIIALLIAILLPVPNRVREQANLIKCLTNLRSMAQAAQLHANDHRGYMPIAGAQAPLSLGIRASSTGLGDDNLVKYIYFYDEGDPNVRYRPLPLSIVLGSYMNSSISTNYRYRFEIQNALLSEDVQRLFACPSQAVKRKGYSISEGGDGWTMSLAEYSSYIFNGCVLALCPAPQGGLMPAGKLTQVRQPSEVFLFAEGYSTDGALSGYGVQCLNKNDATLYDYWFSPGHDWDQFDTSGTAAR
jgi:prepilin-type N-terminal cleavage/methylation domain-containing protein